MLEQLEGDVSRMLQEASHWYFGGDSPIPFLNGYITAITVRRCCSYNTVLHAAKHVIDQRLIALVVDPEVQDAIRQLAHEMFGNPMNEPWVQSSTTTKDS